MFAAITCLQTGALLAFCFILFRIVRAFTDPLKVIPGPFAARFTRLWYLRQLSGGKSRWVEVDLHRRYGPVVRLAPNQYSIDDPEAARQLYGHGANLRKTDWYRLWSSTIVDPHGFQDIFSIQDPHFHHEQKKIVSNLYSMSNVMQMESCVNETIPLLLEAFDTFCEDKTVIDLLYWMRCYAFDTIMYITLNKRFGVLDRDGNDEGLFKIFDAQITVGTLAGVYPTFFRALIEAMVKLPLQQPMERITKFSDRQLEEYEWKHDNEQFDNEVFDEKSIIQRGTMLHRRDPKKFPKDALRIVALMNTAAGSDTTGIALTAILHLLYSFPEALERLRKEIRESKAKLGTGDQVFSYQQAQKMPYLQAVIKESLRLYSPVGISMPRVVPPGGAKIAGHHFPAGTEVGINAWVAHRNAKVFGSDANQFKPERWLHEGADSAAKISNMEAYLLYFGQGSRQCIGKNISLLEMSKVLPEIVTRYDLEFTDEALRKDPQRGVSGAGGWFIRQTNMQCRVKRAETAT